MTHVATIGTATATTAVSNLSITLTAAVSAGHTVVGAVAWESGAGTIPTISTIVDSRGNTYTTTDVSAGAGGNVTVACAIFRARVTTALHVGDTITITITGGTRTRWAAQADDFDDVNSSSPLNVTAHNDAPGSSTSLSSGTTAATAQSYQLDYAAFGYALPSARTVTIPAGWAGNAAVTTGGTTNRGLQAIWRYTAATGTQQGTLTLDAASTYCGAIASYKATSSAPPVGRVSQVKLTIPQGAVPATSRVSQVKLQVPVGVMGVVRVAQVKFRAPTVEGQAPYSGIKFLTADGTLVDSAISAAQGGTV